MLEEFFTYSLKDFFKGFYMYKISLTYFNYTVMDIYVKSIWLKLISICVNIIDSCLFYYQQILFLSIDKMSSTMIYFYIDIRHTVQHNLRFCTFALTFNLRIHTPTKPLVCSGTRDSSTHRDTTCSPDPIPAWVLTKMIAK